MDKDHGETGDPVQNIDRLISRLPMAASLRALARHEQEIDEMRPGSPSSAQL